MPRAPVAGREIRRRSRNGCWNCKARKVKCGEEKPQCSNCERLDEECDYKIRLSWGGRPLKKKQLENGGNAHDPNADDQSQSIPGAGQFSINPHFPAPQAFIQATPANGTPRKPPVPRLGNGKKTNMSTYQTVFAVGETPAPPPSTPAAIAPISTPPTNTSPSSTAQADTHLSLQIPPARVPRPQPSTQMAGSRDERSNSLGWQQNMTPVSNTTPTTLLAPPFEPTRNGHSDQRAYFSPFTPASGPFSPSHNTSPITSFHHSSPGHSSSPDTPYVQPHDSPQQKNFHPPPSILTSPTKKARTSTSPTQPPPMSPYVYGRHSMTSAPQLSTSLVESIGYMNNPATTAPMGDTLMTHPAVTGVGMGSSTVVRRVSVENLLATPLGPEAYGGRFSNGFSEDISGFKTENPLQYGPHVPDLDEDVEEIVRNEFDPNFNTQVNNARQFFRMNSAYLDQVSIPRKLDPLPQWLLENTENNMYFHHYLKHTARLLVPHDCSENPFKHILPQMAVETDHLMNLLLAYAASHQARLLGRPEPTERISRFIDETVRSLNVTLNDSEDATSDASLATAIMLASYQIVSPNPFAASGLTWQTHLNAARKIIATREGKHTNGTVSNFLVRQWFAYLDLLGRLSGREIDEPVVHSSKYWSLNDGDEQAACSVDCFFGFTTRCVVILHGICELARECEAERRVEAERRMNPARMVSNEPTDMLWSPSAEVRRKAQDLRDELRESKMRSISRCNHVSCGYGPHSDDFDEEELLATNDAFHWAAEIHLYRRVLGLPSSHIEVQVAVGHIVRAMHRVKRGGTAENCLLFPLFTAGCETINPKHRQYTLGRMLEVEKTGLTQVKNARLLMERVWNEGVAWWEIVDGEFIG